MCVEVCVRVLRCACTTHAPVVQIHGCYRQQIDAHEEISERQVRYEERVHLEHGTATFSSQRRQRVARETQNTGWGGSAHGDANAWRVRRKTRDGEV